MDRINNAGNAEPLKKVENKRNKKDKSSIKIKPEQKIGDLSRQIEYLGAINKVNINKKNVSPSNMQENISFKGSMDSNKKFTALSNEEYEKLKEKINEKLEQNPELEEHIQSSMINKNNILLADKILSDERLFDNPNFMKYAEKMISAAGTTEQAQAKCDMIDKILSDERLFDNPDFMKYAGGMVSAAVNTTEQAQAKCDVIDKILSDERLYNNQHYMNIKTFMYILKGSKTYEQAQAKCDMIDKILSDERLFDNPDFMEESANIVSHTHQNPRTNSGEM